jgi:putative DNA methylase
MTPSIRKKLIEVALPLNAINLACAHEGSPFIPRHPRSLHVWWARRRLAVARAVIFAQTVDDPSSCPDLFPSEAQQGKERERLFHVIEELVKWENTTNETVLEQARVEIWLSWRRACADNADYLRAKELFDPHKLPAFHDPFAGGGGLPLEAQRLGLESYASDLNPVAVLINKAMIEIPPKFAGKPPVNPKARSDKSLDPRRWRGAQGLTEDVLYYGHWMRDEAERRIGHLFPKIEITAEMARERPDLIPVVGQSLTVLAWLWARTVKSPNPAFGSADVPLVSTFMLSTKAGKEVYVEPVTDHDRYRFKVNVGRPKDITAAKKGTKLGKSNFRCVLSGSVIEAAYIRSEAQAGRMGVRLMAIVAERPMGRVYLNPTTEMERVARLAKPVWKPDLKVPTPCHDVDRLPMYGMPTWGDAFTPRQLVALTTFSELVAEAHERAKRDALAAGFPEGKSFRGGGTGALAYADALCVYFGLVISRWTDLFCNLSAWNSTNENIKNLFSRHSIPMIWDYAESNPFGPGASFSSTINVICKAFVSLPAKPEGFAFELNASTQHLSTEKIVSTDPPYYDNVGYADLSDFFYVWLRRSQQHSFPELFSTLAVPKTEELVANPYRHGSKAAAEKFFLDGMTRAMRQLAEQAHPAFPVTIYYAFKQSESDFDAGTASTGWETFLEAMIQSGLSIVGTWPVRTERIEALKKHVNALASSIVLVCRPRPETAPTATRRDFVAALKTELPVALGHLQHGNIAPVDLAQAAIGPGMAVYTRYAKVLDAEGKPLSVRQALALINETLDEALTEQEGDFDADSRWAVTWFEQSGFGEGDYGVAEQLSKSKNTSVAGMAQARILSSRGGKVRLFKPEEMPADWDPATDPRLTAWEVVHQLIRSLEAGGEGAAAGLVAKLGTKAEIARELAYRLYTVCERKKRAVEALSYNGLVQSWPEITRLAREEAIVRPTQPQLI